MSMMKERAAGASAMTYQEGRFNRADEFSPGWMRAEAARVEAGRVASAPRRQPEIDIQAETARLNQLDNGGLPQDEWEALKVEARWKTKAGSRAAQD